MDTRKVFGGIVLALSCAAASAATVPVHRTVPHRAVQRRPVTTVHRAVPVKGKTAVKPVAKPAAVTASAAPRPTSMIGGMPWYRPIDGFALAKKQHKPIMVDVFTDWCGWCKVLDRETFPNPAVKEVLMKNFILVKANAEDNADGQKLATENQVDGFPTIMFFDSNGKLKAFSTGFHPPAEFLAGLHEFLGDAKPIASDQKAQPEKDAVSVHPSAPEGTSVNLPTHSADPKPASEEAVSDPPKTP